MKYNKVLMMIATIASLSACKEEQKAPFLLPVGAVKVEPADIPLSFEFAAKTQGSREAEVRAQVGGILLKRNYTEGQKVNEGDILFEIDPAPFEVALSQAEAKLEQSKANLTAAESQWKRIEQLFKEKVVSEKSRDDAKASVDSLNAAVALAEAEVRSAKLNLDYATVKAPISGVTSMEVQSEGNLINVNSSLTTITQLDPIYVIFSASENDVINLGAKIEQGLISNPFTKNEGKVSAVIKYSNGYVYPQEGEINFIDSSVDPSTGTVKVRAVFPNPQNRVLPGQFVRIIINGLVRKNAITVPQEAVMQSSGGTFVYKINQNNEIEVAPVSIGMVTPDKMWIINEGLSVGDVVAINNIMKLRPQMKVNPVVVEQPKKQPEQKSAEGENNETPAEE